MVVLLLVGSIGAGKSTLGRALTSLLKQRGYPSKYIEININHGFAYVLTRLLATKILKYRYISNYYFTIRFGNFNFFCKYLKLMMLLDILYAPIKTFISLISFRLVCSLLRKSPIIILDEYYLTAIAEYFYHLSHACKSGSRTLKLFYNIIFRIALLPLKGDVLVVAFFYTPLNNSIKALFLRDNTYVIDIAHLELKHIYVKVIIRELERYLGNVKIETFSFNIINFPDDSRNSAKTILALILKSRIKST